MEITSVRKWVIVWLYSFAMAHLFLGMLVTWMGDLPLFESYHRLLEGAFWINSAPQGVLQFQVWWLGLFGATVQALGIWMAVLIYLGERYRSRFAWGGLLVGFAVWAPQDILLSLHANVWIHVWLDLLVLLCVVPPLLWLWRCDAHEAPTLEKYERDGEPICFSKTVNHVLVTGGTGFIGQLLVRELLANGQDLVVLTRGPRAAAWLFNGRVKCIRSMEDLPNNYPLDVIINLAGARILGWRWTAARKQILLQSRVSITQSIVAWIAAAEHKPRLFITGSAVGYYGIQARGDSTPLTEQSPPQPIFMSQLCCEWEQAASCATDYGVPVVRLRLGVVLGRRGPLAAMLLPIKLGLGGAMGGGRQWLSWIHVRDVLRAIAHVWQLHHTAESTVNSYVYNLTAPDVVSQHQFNQIAARVLYRPCLVPTPGWPVRLALGEQADLLLEGQYVVPQKLLETGFQFEYPKLEDALKDLRC